MSTRGDIAYQAAPYPGSSGGGMSGGRKRGRKGCKSRRGSRRGSRRSWWGGVGSPQSEEIPPTEETPSPTGMDNKGGRRRRGKKGCSRRRPKRSMRSWF